MNFKTQFRNIPIGHPFLYNDIFYIKENDSEGVSQRLGRFTIHPDEIVESAHEVEKTKLNFWGPSGIFVVTIALVPFLLLFAYLLWESL